MGYRIIVKDGKRYLMLANGYTVRLADNNTKETENGHATSPNEKGPRAGLPIAASV